MPDPTVQTAFPIGTILVPQGAEYRAIQRGCQQAQTAVSVVPLPMGTAAGQRLEQWMKKYRRFADAGYLLVGLGGGLSPDLKVGDGVLCEMTRTMAQTDSIEFDSDLNEWVQGKLPGLKTGKAVGCDRVITLATERQTLYQSLGASVVEMESLSVMKILHEQGKRLAMIRVISDDYRHNLPDISDAIRPDGSLHSITLASQLVRQPIGAGRLIMGALRGLSALEKLIFQLLTR
jgi:purine-nucleoside phosphorylase